MQFGKARTGHSAALTCHSAGPHTPPRSRCVVWTRGGSRMRESRTYGSVRGALSNERPYRDAHLAPCPRGTGQRGRASLCPPYEAHAVERADGAHALLCAPTVTRASYRTSSIVDGSHSAICGNATIKATARHIRKNSGNA